MKKSLFQLHFIKYEEGHRIEIAVKEVEELDLREIKKRLKKGETVLIELKTKQKLNMKSVAMEVVTSPWYFTHI